jgi:hypothetical protein
LIEAARKIRIPALLVRGRSAELVKEAHAREFLGLVPHADYVDVSGAQHMAAGDRNVTSLLLSYRSMDGCRWPSEFRNLCEVDAPSVPDFKHFYDV